jgi:signal transduction histidine kinase
MEMMIERVLILLTTPPGNIAYFLVLLLSIAGAFQGTWEKKKKPIDADLRRLMLCLLVLAGTILLPFLLQILINMGVPIRQGAYHLVEDTCISIGIIWIVKCWLNFEHQKMKDLIPTILTGFLIIVALVISLLFRIVINNNLYKHSIPDNSWHILTAIFILAALIILFIKRRKGFWIGALIFVLLMAGQILYLVTFYQGTDPTGTVRLFQLLSYPFMLALPIIYQTEEEKDESTTHFSEIDIEKHLAPERVQVAVYNELVQPIIALLESDREDFKLELVKIMSEKMGAEVATLCKVKNDESIIFHSGCDLVTGKRLAQSDFIDINLAREIKSHLEGKAAILESIDHPEFQEMIRHAIGIDKPGDLLVAPIPCGEKPIQPEAFLLLNSHSNRNWSEDAVILTETYCRAIGPFYRFHNQQSNLAHAYELANVHINNATEEIREFREVNPWFAESDFENLNLEEMIKQLLNEFETLKRSVDEVQKVESREKDKEANSDILQYQAQFKLLLNEVARLKQDLAAVDKEILQTEKETPIKQPEPDTEHNLTIFSKKIREPLTVIIEFTNLLLSETLGILGAKQFNCLFKIKESSLSIQKYLDEVSREETNQDVKQTDDPFFDLDPLVDQAIMKASVIMKDRKIALHLELPQQLPKVQIARDSLQETFNQLFLIASELCDENGIIKFQLKFILVESKDFLQINMDKIGGDPLPSQLADELEKMEQSITDERQVSSDVQQRMKILRSLVYEISGRTWVEDLPGGGFSINLLLPYIKESSPGAIH